MGRLASVGEHEGDMRVEKEIRDNLDWFVPAQMHDDIDEQRRAHLLVFFSFSIAAFGTFFSWFLTQDGGVARAALGSVYVGTVLMWLNPFLLRQYKSTRFCGLLTVVTMQSAMTVSALAGAGIEDASLWWLLLTPVLAGFLLGGRLAVGFGFAVFSEYWIIFSLDEKGVLSDVINDEPGLWIAICASSAVLVLTLLTWGYERARAQGRRQLDQKLGELESANQALEVLRAQEKGRRELAENRDAEKSHFLKTMGKNAFAQGEALEDASAALTQMHQSLADIADNVTELRSAASASEGAASAVTAGSDAMARNTSEMASAANNVATAIEVLAKSMHGVNIDVGALDQVAQRAVSEMREMNESALQVETRAESAVLLSEQARNDAERGSDAVLHALEGINTLHQSSSVVSEAIEALTGGVGQIGQVLQVIDEVVSQTQLLALNASIIGSQAGENGRGFMVVAAEIKKLSERTNESTSAIGRQIRALTLDADRARNAMTQGDEAVRRTLALSETARSALSTIANSAQMSCETVSDIAEATSEQGARARRMGEAMTQVAATLREVAAEVATHSRGTERVFATTKQMRSLSDEVAMASDDQAQGGQKIETAVTRIHDMVRMIGNAHAEQTRGSDLILRSIEAIHQRQIAQLASIDEMKAD